MARMFVHFQSPRLLAWTLMYSLMVDSRGEHDSLDIFYSLARRSGTGRGINRAINPAVTSC